LNNIDSVEAGVVATVTVLPMFEMGSTGTTTVGVEVCATMDGTCAGVDELTGTTEGAEDETTAADLLVRIVCCRTVVPDVEGVKLPTILAALAL